MIPVWAVWILLAQFKIMYLYAGFVKINPDWTRQVSHRLLGLLARIGEVPVPEKRAWVGR